MWKIKLKEASYQVSLLLFWLTLCIALTINFHPLYWWFSEHYNLAKLVSLNEQGLRKEYLTLLAYLNYPWVRSLDLVLPVSYNGMRHFEDVKNLFLLDYVVLLLTAFPAIKYLKELITKKQVWRLQNKIYGLFIVLFGIALFLSIDFERFFVLFHEVLFRNSDWIFDPALDPIILVLPSEFFLACFALFIGLFAIGAIVLVLLGKYQLKRSK